MLRKTILLTSACFATAAAQSLSGDGPRWDSTAFLRDSALIDSIARRVPVDSLRRLYRAVTVAPGPFLVIRAIQCESYRLWYTYGAAADLAEDRVRALEWKPESDSIVTTTLRTMSNPLERDTTRRWIPVGADRCGADRATARIVPRLRYRYSRPPKLRLRFTSPMPRDSLRQGDSYFEAAISTPDSTIDLAGTATLQWSGNESLGLSLRDHTQRSSNYGITLIRSGLEYLRAGSYPVLSTEDHDVVTDAVGAAISLYFVSVNGGGDKLSGTFVVDRADTLGAEGHAEFTILRFAIRPYLRRAARDSLGDTVRVALRFRARYADLPPGYRLFRMPPFPHRMRTGPAPDAAKRSRDLFLSETVPCERLPIYSPETTLEPLPSTSTREVARAAIHTHLWQGQWRIDVMSVDDTSLTRTFRSQTGLRFRRTSPGQVIERVRCTLTLRRPP